MKKEELEETIASINRLVIEVHNLNEEINAQLASIHNYAGDSVLAELLKERGQLYEAGITRSYMAMQLLSHTSPEMFSTHLDNCRTVEFSLRFLRSMLLMLVRKASRRYGGAVGEEGHAKLDKICSILKEAMQLIDEAYTQRAIREEKR